MQQSAFMLLTIESTAWAVTFSAGLTTGTILGFGVTGRAIAAVLAITAIAVSTCALLLRRIRA